MIAGFESKGGSWRKDGDLFSFRAWLPPSCHLLCKLQGSSRCPWFMPFLSLSTLGRAGSQNSTCLWAPCKPLERQALSGQDAEGCRGREVPELSDQATGFSWREELCHWLRRLQMGFGELLSQRPGFPGGWDGKEPACNVEDLGSIPGSGRSPGEENGNSLQHSCLENPMDRGTWWATVHGSQRVRHNWVTNIFTFQSKPCSRTCSRPWWTRMWLPVPVFLPGESHGWRNLADYSPWSCKKSDTIKHARSALIQEWLSQAEPPDGVWLDQQPRQTSPAARGCRWVSPRAHPAGKQGFWHAVPMRARKTYFIVS